MRRYIFQRVIPLYRIARFGSFEIFKTLDPMTGRRGPSIGRNDILKTLLNYVVSTFYPEVELFVYDYDQSISNLDRIKIRFR